MLGYEAPYKKGVLGSRQNPLWGLTKSRIIQSSLSLKLYDLIFVLIGNKKIKKPSELRKNPPWKFVDGEKYGVFDWNTLKIRQGLSSLSHILFWKALDVMQSQQVHPAVKVAFGVTFFLPMLLTGVALGVASYAIYTAFSTIALGVGLALLLPVLIPMNIVTNEIRKSQGLEKITVADASVMGEKEMLLSSVQFTSGLTGVQPTSDDFDTTASLLGIRKETMADIETEFTTRRGGPGQ